MTMLNRTNRTLSANLNRLNLGTRTLANGASLNNNGLTLRALHAIASVVHPRQQQVVVRPRPERESKSPRSSMMIPIIDSMDSYSFSPSSSDVTLRSPGSWLWLKPSATRAKGLAAQTEATGPARLRLARRTGRARMTCARTAA